MLLSELNMFTDGYKDWFLFVEQMNPFITVGSGIALPNNNVILQVYRLGLLWKRVH